MTSSVDTGGVFQDLQEREFSLHLVRRARVSSVEIKRRCSLRSRVGAVEEAPGVIVHRQVEPRVGGANALSNATSGTVVGSEAGQRRKTVQRTAFVDRDRGRGCAFFIEHTAVIYSVTGPWCARDGGVRRSSGDGPEALAPIRDRKSEQHGRDQPESVAERSSSSSL